MIMICMNWLISGFMSDIMVVEFYIICFGQMGWQTDADHI